MELLTGKAKEAFNNFCKENSYDMVYLERLNYDPDTIIKLQVKLQNILIIDFFDSVGIIINTPSKYMYVEKYNRGFECVVIEEESGETYNLHAYNDVFGTRQEATIAGIKKANEIFNSKF